MIETSVKVTDDSTTLDLNKTLGFPISLQRR